MEAKTAIQYFGSQTKLARALGISDAAVARWKRDGRVPRGKAFELQLLTGGELLVDPGIYVDPPRSTAAQ